MKDTALDPIIIRSGELVFNTRDERLSGGVCPILSYCGQIVMMTYHD